MSRRLLFSFLTCLLLTTVYGQAPVASITTTSITTACPPFVVQFNGANTGGPATTITYNYGGGPPDVVGPIAGVMSPAVIFNTPGTYQVYMTLTNASGTSNSNIITVIVNDVPKANFTASATTGCFPFTVTFNNTSTGAGITKYVWDFGDGQTSNQQSPTHTYNLAGNFAVTLIDSNNLGCAGSKTDTNFIQIPSGVIADFSYSFASSCKPPSTAYFKDQSIITGTPSWTWDFGDGSPPVTGQQNPSHIFNASGTYKVALKISSSLGCVATDTQVVNISAIGVSSSFTSPDTICVNYPANFNNTSSPNPNSSTWYFGDGANFSSSNSTASHVYNTVGNYTVSLVSQFSTCSDSVTKPIHVVGATTVDFNSVGTTNSCQFPFTVNFQANAPGASSWSWDFGDGSPPGSGPNPSHTYTSYGQFTVTLTASTTASCGNTVSKPQFVKVVQPAIYANLPAYGCAPYAFTLAPTYVTVDGIASYSWDMGNGNIYTIANPPAQIYGPGNYIITGTITTNGGCTATLKDTIKVGTVKPVPAFTANPIPACVGQVIQFTDQSTGSPDQWTWYFGDGGTWTSQNPKHSYDTPGTYSVKLIVYNNGCLDSLTKANYIIIKPPLAKFGYTYNCGNKTTYDLHDSSIGADSWIWDFGDGTPTSNLQNPSHLYSNAGNYTITLTVKNNASGCSNSAQIKITAGVKPDFAFFPKNSACKGTPVNVSATVYPPNTKTWAWDFLDGSPIAYSPSWTHYFANAGSNPVKLIVTDSLGCSDSVTNSIQINGPKANFGTPTTQACNSLTATFTDSSSLNGGSSPIVKWVWDYGDGSTATGQNPGPHTYTKQGSFPVKLTVTDGSGCSDSLSKGNYIRLSVLNVSFTSQDSNYCPTSLIKFTNTSDPLGGFNTVYTWDFGDGNNFTGFSPPLHSYPGVGLYTINLQAKDQYGCTGSFTKSNFIRVDTPNANFNIDKAFASCPPLNVSFTFAGHYAKTFLYNFGSGQGVSPDSNTQHLYGFPGTYQASLTVTSPGGCIATTTKTIQVNGPIINFTYSPLGGCDSLTVFFNAIGTGIIRYVWYFTDGSVADTTTIPTVTHTYLHPNKYSPIVAVTDSTNCTVFYPAPVPIVVDSVKANFIADKYRLCENGLVNFTNTSDTTAGTVISNYSWDFGDGHTSSGPNIPAVSNTYSSPGLYHVTLTVNTQFGCADVVTKDIYVVANPTVDIAGDSSQCVPATLNFSGIELVPDTSVLKWHWDFANGDTSNLQVPPSQTYTKAGQYLISLVATNSSGCTDTATSDIFIYPLPTVFAGNDTTICLGQSLPIQVVGAATYTWLPPNNTLSCTNCANPVASPTVTTTYYVQGTSFQGCNSIDTIVVTVNQPVTITVSPNDSVCLGQSAQLMASGAAIYAWSPAAGLSNTKVANPLASPSTTTTYQVIGSDNKYCFFDTGYVNVRVFNYPVVNAGPDATITVGSSYQMLGSGSSDVVSIAWTPITALTCTDCYTPTANPNNTTNYTLKVVNDGGCVSTDSMRLTVVCNNSNFFIPNTFSPNGDGVNDIFYVRGKGLNIISSITIFNRWGQIVFQRKDFAANDPSVGWDGTFNGQKAAADVYVYTVEIICDNSSIVPYHGNVALIR